MVTVTPDQLFDIKRARVGPIAVNPALLRRFGGQISPNPIDRAYAEIWREEEKRRAAATAKVAAVEAALNDAAKVLLRHLKDSYVGRALYPEKTIVMGKRPEDLERRLNFCDRKRPVNNFEHATAFTLVASFPSAWPNPVLHIRFGEEFGMEYAGKFSSAQEDALIAHVEAAIISYLAKEGRLRKP